MAHPVMWFEVLGANAGKLREFYSGLFGWTFRAEDPMQYGVVDTGARRGIPGGIGEIYPGTRSWVTFYVETPSIEASLADVQRRGGKVVVPRTVMPDVTLAVFEDPEGHAIGLVEARPA
ncbi:MAG TPA: VOC family protein [Vicinamibacterales bacterium]|nr:VOC family protein [Vicinamibacterales bacterium]